MRKTPSLIQTTNAPKNKIWDSGKRKESITKCLTFFTVSWRAIKNWKILEREKAAKPMKENKICEAPARETDVVYEKCGDSLFFSL